MGVGSAAIHVRRMLSSGLGASNDACLEFSDGKGVVGESAAA